MSSINNLPPEVIDLILQKLPSEDVRHFGLGLNDRFKDVANGVLKRRSKLESYKVI